MIGRIVRWLFRYRFLSLGIIALVTLFFVFQIGKIKITTRLSDLLPQGHSYIKIHQKYEKQLGDPFKVFLMLEVKKGDIYNEETLKKVKRITDDLDLIPGVNHNQIYSIGSRKIKKVTITGDSVITENFMDEVPLTDKAMDTFRETVRNTRAVYGIWVSPDERCVLFTVGFISDLVDYDVLFKKVGEIVSRESDDNHIVYAAGEPFLTGLIYSFQKEMYLIFGITFAVLFTLLYFYFRNLMGVVVPTLSTALGAIWGLGFCGFLGYNLDPLILVVPLLIAARALSHSVQVTERYFECYQEYGEVIPTCVGCSTSILPPGILGILTDGIGILLIAVAPIPLIQKLAYICTFWAFSILFTGLIFTPIIISFFTPPRNIPEIVDMNRGITQKVLGGIARLGFGRTGVVIFAGAVVIAGVSGWIASKVDIGDINPGTPILWKDSDYNNAIGQMNRNFPGTEELYVIIEGEGEKAAEEPEFLRVLDSFQRHMEKSPGVAATLSIGDFFPPIRKNIYGGYPKWEILPTRKEQSSQLFYLLLGNAAPGDFDRYVSRVEDVANVIIWYKDHMGETMREAIAAVKEFMERHKEVLLKKRITFQLASGNIGILAALNETVKESQFLNFILVMGVIFLLCSLTYQSMVAAIILMIPLNLANLITLSIMKGLGIGLNLNTLPIVSVGVGVGIDYGIYLLSRLCEEYQARGEYSLETATRAIKTTGKAIFFTATTMIAGVIFWYFLSSLRFQAEMGLLLAIIMFINMVGALVLIPSLVYVFKPKFLGRVKLLVKE